MSEGETQSIISVRVRIQQLSLARPEPPYITVSYQTLDTPQAFGGSIVLSRDEVNQSGIMVGDHVTIRISFSRE